MLMMMMTNHHHLCTKYIIVIIQCAKDTFKMLHSPPSHCIQITNDTSCHYTMYKCTLYFMLQSPQNVTKSTIGYIIWVRGSLCIVQMLHVKATSQCK